MKRINGIFISLIGMLALSMSLMAQDVATVTDGVPVIVEAIRGFWKSMPGWVSMALNWVLGVGICMFGWWQDLGFLADLDWQIALMYGIGAGIAASGFAETGLIQWLISLFTRKKKKGA